MKLKKAGKAKTGEKAWEWKQPGPRAISVYDVEGLRGALFSDPAEKRRELNACRLALLRMGGCPGETMDAFRKAAFCPPETGIPLLMPDRERTRFFRTETLHNAISIAEMLNGLEPGESSKNLSLLKSPSINPLARHGGTDYLASLSSIRRLFRFSSQRFFDFVSEIRENGEACDALGETLASSAKNTDLLASHPFLRLGAAIAGSPAGFGAFRAYFSLIADEKTGQEEFDALTNREVALAALHEARKDCFEDARKKIAGIVASH
jgi:hypothetical protein